jgi:hypothetical protein
VANPRDDVDGEQPRRQRAEKGADGKQQQARRQRVGIAGGAAREPSGVMLPVGQQQDRDRNGECEQAQEPDRLEQSAPQPGAGCVFDRAVVGRRLLRGRTVIVLAVRDALTSLQG